MSKSSDAIRMYAAVRRGEAVPEPGAGSGIGANLDKYQSREAALGERAFVDDLQADGLLFAAPRLSDHPRALVKRIDSGPANRIDGVVRVLTADDVPGDRIIGLIENGLAGPFVATGEETRCIGDMLAVVVARSKTHRSTGSRCHRHRIRRARSGHRRPPGPRNPAPHAFSRTATSFPDHACAAATPNRPLADSAHVVEHTFHTQRIEHLFLEPESCVARPDGFGGLLVYSQGQGVFEDRRQIAAVLGVEQDLIRVNLVANGGAFGGKEDLSVQAQTAPRCLALQCPGQDDAPRERRASASIPNATQWSCITAWGATPTAC